VTFYDFLSLKNDVTVASTSNTQKKNFLVAIMKVTDEIAGSGSGSGVGLESESGSVSQRSGSGSVPKCHGSATLLERAITLLNCKLKNFVFILFCAAPSWLSQYSDSLLDLSGKKC
jgi:hypothetical protein